jgi:SAM-dependent methyltransferase
MNSESHCLCGVRDFKRATILNRPPAGEIKFEFSSGGEYRREILKCNVCGHYISVHEMDDSSLYSGDYVTSNYGDDGLIRAFERVISLDPKSSDNVGRVDRILEFSQRFFRPDDFPGRAPKVLDVGSGLCVFLNRMKEFGWSCTAIDPDMRSVKHASERVGVNAVHGDFMTIQDIGQYDLITFNKVLEHVKDPVSMLSRSMKFLLPKGLVYIELPDGESSSLEGFEREEFTIDHHHIFSMASMVLLSVRAGFTVSLIERIREPSSKYTLYAFIYPSAA